MIRIWLTVLTNVLLTLAPTATSAVPSLDTFLNQSTVEAKGVMGGEQVMLLPTSSTKPAF